MPANERRFWPRLDVHRHVLGELAYMYIGQTRVRALMLYETSVERDQIPAELPTLRGKVIGDVDGLVCTLCGKSVADWHISDDAIEALISRVMGGG